MITTSQMYWLTRLAAINSIGAILLFIGIIALIVVGIFAIISFVDPEFEKGAVLVRTVWLRICLPVVLIGAAVVMFVPTAKEMAAIIVVPRIANNEKVQDVGNEIYGLAVQWLKDLRARGDAD